MSYNYTSRQKSNYEMTSGIYIINDTSNKVYIGKSSNIEDRWSRHKRDLINGRHHSYKLQKAYNIGSVFEYSVLVVEAATNLEELEVLFISEFDSYYSGYNCTTGKSVTGSGYSSVNALYTRDTYVQIVQYLAYTSLLVKDIAIELDVSIQVVANISILRKHHWIEHEMPIEYLILQEKYSAINGRPRGTDPIIEVAFKELVNTSKSLEQIVEETGIKKKQLQHILYGTAYVWLQAIYPLEYTKLSNRLKYAKN